MTQLEIFKWEEERLNTGLADEYEIAEVEMYQEQINREIQQEMDWLDHINNQEINEINEANG